jgi:hypothetical protein
MTKTLIRLSAGKGGKLREELMKAAEVAGGRAEDLAIDLQ